MMSLVASFCENDLDMLRYRMALETKTITSILTIFPFSRLLRNIAAQKSMTSKHRREKKCRNRAILAEIKLNAKKFDEILLRFSISRGAKV